MKEIRNNRYIILIASVFLQFCYGIAYVWSVFQPYVKQRYEMDTGSANMPFAMLLAWFSVGNVVGGLLQKKVKALYIVIFGNACLVLGLFLSALVPEGQGFLLNISYGILGGFGGGIAYNTTVAVVQKHFPEKRGLVTGILICSTGSFGLIMNPLAHRMLSNYGYEKGTLIVTGIMALCLILGSGFIQNPSDDKFVEMKNNQIENKADFSISEVLKTPQYYIITLSMMLAVPGYFLISPMLMTLGIDKGLSEQASLFGVMVLAVMNTGGRLLAPWISDWMGRQSMLITLFSINILAVLLVIFLSNYQFIVAIGLVGFTYGGFMGMYPTITVDYFGSKYNGINYGAVMIGYGISSLTCPYLVKAVQASTMGTMLSLGIAAGASVFGIILMLILRRPNANVIPQTAT